MAHKATQNNDYHINAECVYNAKMLLLNKALESVVFEGWKDLVLEQASEALGHSATYGYAYFPAGVADLAAFYVETVDAQMQEKLAAVEWSGMKVRDKIREAVLLRLSIYAKQKEAVRSLISFYAYPQVAPQGAAAIWRTVDAMWYAAGDTSTDYNYYTKRALLYAVYSATVLCWLKDDSEDMQKTKLFLEKRINDVMQIEKAKGKVKGLFDKLSRKG